MFCINKMLNSIVQFCLFRLDAEFAHNLTIQALRKGFGPSYPSSDDPALKVRLWDKTFPNPVGLAAGFDKNAQVIAPILNLGFGFTEVGTVTPRPQQGNPKPRVFRATGQHAVINRMGFPNLGLKNFQENLTEFLEQKPRPSGLVGLNIGVNKENMAKDFNAATRDYMILLRALAPMADYLVVNISSPNTAGLRNFQSASQFRKLMDLLKTERDKTCGQHPPPLLVKLAPDLSDADIQELAKTALDINIDGLILTNTTLSRPQWQKQKPFNEKFKMQKGGLSGKPLFKKSNSVIKSFYQHTKGQIPIIGAGGIETGQDAFEKILSGASLIQLYTGLVYQGPSVANHICSDLSRLLKDNGYKNIQDAVGKGDDSNKN